MSQSLLPTDFTLADRLCQLPYFDVLGTDICIRLSQQAIRRECQAGEVLFLEGDPSAGLWLVELGRVKVYKLNPDGREHILYIFGEGDSFNEIPALDGDPNAASAAVIDDAVLWIIPSEVMSREIETSRELALQVIKVLASRLRMLVDQIEGLALHSVMVRLARFLLERADEPVFDAPAVTRATVAAYLGTTPETVSRMLRSLEEAKAIEFDRHRIVIIDETALRDIAMLT